MHYLHPSRGSCPRPHLRDACQGVDLLGGRRCLLTTRSMGQANEEVIVAARRSRNQNQGCQVYLDQRCEGPKANVELGVETLPREGL